MSQASTAPKGFLSVMCNLFDDYKKTTPKKLKLIDAYLFCIMLTGIIQFVYCCLVGTFPFNAFLSGFISTVACFVLAGRNLRIFKKIFKKNYYKFKFFKSFISYSNKQG